MTSAISVNIYGLKEIQRANQRLVASTKASGALGHMIKIATLDAQRHAIWNTPWDTTVLKHSHTAKVKGTKGKVYINPGVVNVARGGKRAAVYGAELHTQGFIPGRRGGVRAFYQYTVEHDGPEIATKAVKAYLRMLP